MTLIATFALACAFAGYVAGYSHAAAIRLSRSKVDTSTAAFKLTFISLIPAVALGNELFTQYDRTLVFWGGMLIAIVFGFLGYAYVRWTF